MSGLEAEITPIDDIGTLRLKWGLSEEKKCKEVERSFRIQFCPLKMQLEKQKHEVVVNREKE